MAIDIGNPGARRQDVREALQEYTGRAPWLPTVPWEPGTYPPDSTVTHINSTWYTPVETDEVPGPSATDWRILLDGSSVAADRVVVEEKAAVIAEQALQVSNDKAEILAALPVTRGSWLALAGIVGTRDGQSARCNAPLGTQHMDPIKGISVEDQGEYTWHTTPPAWEWISEIKPADVAGAIARSTRFATLDDNARFAFVGIDLGNISWGDLKALLEGLVGTNEHTFPVKDVVVSSTSKWILPPDPDRISFALQKDAFTLALQEDEPATLDGAPWMVEAGAGGFESRGVFGKGAIAAIAAPPRDPETGDIPEGPVPDVPIFLSVTRRVAVEPTPIAPADRILLEWPDEPDIRLYNAAKAKLTKWMSLGIYDLVGGIWFLAGASAQNNRIDLRNPTGVKADYENGSISGSPTSVVTTPYGWAKGGGGGANINTHRLPADVKITRYDHMLMAKAGSNEVDGGSTGGMLLGFAAALALQPNRGATDAGYRDGSTLIVRTSGATGKAATLIRRDDTGFEPYVDGVKQTFETRASGLLANVPLRILAMNDSTNVSNSTIVAARYAVAGPGIGFTESFQGILHADLIELCGVSDTIRAGLHP